MVVTIVVAMDVAYGSPAAASGNDADARTVPPSERIERMGRAVSGDLAELAELQDEDDASRWAQLVRGLALGAAGRDREAVEALEHAARSGHNLAPRVLALHHYERNQWIDAYAWARVAMEVDAALGDLEMADLQGGWSLYLAVQSAESLDAEQHGDADRRARDLLAEFLDPLVAEDLARDDAKGFEGEDVVARRRPVFPRSMWENGRPGWAYVYFAINRDGSVGETLALAASHPRFGRAAARAVRKWRFDTEAFDDLPATGLQLIDFDLR
ncbi:energy transducer TonB [Halomonas denitrificans]|nr:energy transducer TonB [Halomonas denitrificans]